MVPNSFTLSECRQKILAHFTHLRSLIDTHSTKTIPSATLSSKSTKAVQELQLLTLTTHQWVPTELARGLEFTFNKLLMTEDAWGLVMFIYWEMTGNLATFSSADGQMRENELTAQLSLCLSRMPFLVLLTMLAHHWGDATDVAPGSLSLPPAFGLADRSLWSVFHATTGVDKTDLTLSHNATKFRHVIEMKVRGPNKAFSKRANGMFNIFEKKLALTDPRLYEKPKKEESDEEVYIESEDEEASTGVGEETSREKEGYEGNEDDDGESDGGDDDDGEVEVTEADVRRPSKISQSSARTTIIHEGGVLKTMGRTTPGLRNIIQILGYAIPAENKTCFISDGYETLMELRLRKISDFPCAWEASLARVPVDSPEDWVTQMFILVSEVFLNSFSVDLPGFHVVERRTPGRTLLNGLRCNLTIWFRSILRLIQSLSFYLLRGIAIYCIGQLGWGLKYGLGGKVVRYEQKSWWGRQLLLPLAHCLEARQARLLVPACGGFFLKEFRLKALWTAEVAAYNRLKELDCVPRALASGRGSNGTYFLVLTDVGKPLEKEDLTYDVIQEFYETVLIKVHSKNVHHHDLHSGNIMRDSAGRLGLIDFANSVKPCGEGRACLDICWMRDNGFVPGRLG